MKVLAVFSVVFLGVNAALDKEYVDKLLKQIHEVGQTCAAEVHATPADMAELMAYKPPSTHEAKCVISCFYKHFKIMKDDGTFDKQATIAVFDEIKGLDAELYEKIMKIVDTCSENKQMFDDHCESASSMAMCVSKEAEAAGIHKSIVV